MPFTREMTAPTILPGCILAPLLVYFGPTSMSMFAILALDGRAGSSCGVVDVDPERREIRVGYQRGSNVDGNEIGFISSLAFGQFCKVL